MRRAISAQARLALRGQQLRDVIEGHDVAADPVRVVLGRDPYQQAYANRPGRLSSICASAERSGAVATCARPPTSGITAIKGRPIRSSGAVLIRSAAERFGKVMRPWLSRPSTPADTPPITVSVNRRRIQLLIGVDQFRPLAGQLRGHPVERAGELVNLVALLLLWHRGAQIADAHPVGGRDQPRDRHGQPIGEAQADTHRGQQQQQRDHAEIIAKVT